MFVPTSLYFNSFLCSGYIMFWSCPCFRPFVRPPEILFRHDVLRLVTYSEDLYRMIIVAGRGTDMILQLIQNRVKIAARSNV